MKNLTKSIGIIAFIAAIVFSMVGCDLPKNEFPSEFRGTWERDYVSVYFQQGNRDHPNHGYRVVLPQKQ